MSPRSALHRCRQSGPPPHRNLIPDLPARSESAVPTELSLPTIIIIIIIIIIILVITFMQGAYNYIPETNPVSTVCSVAAVLYLQSLLHVMLFRPCNMFCTVTAALSAVPNMAVFGSSLISCFLAMLFRYCLSYFDMVPVATIITGITFAFTFHMC